MRTIWSHLSHGISGNPYHFSYTIFPLIHCRTKSVVYIAKSPLSVTEVGKMVLVGPGSIISQLSDGGKEGLLLICSLS